MYMRKGIKKTNNVFDGTHNILLTRKQVLLYNYCIIPRTYEEIVFYAINMASKRMFQIKKEEISQVIRQLQSLGILTEVDNLQEAIKTHRVINIKNDKLDGRDKEIYYALKVNGDVDCLIDKFGERSFIDSVFRMIENKNICII